MEFENRIKKIAGEIYKEVVAVVDDNITDEDIYYSYAYLKLPSGRQLLYNFDTKDLCYTRSDVFGYQFFVPMIKILGNETEYNNKVLYDTAILSKIKNSLSESKKSWREKEYERQQKLSEKDKNKILKYYYKLKDEIKNIEFDAEKTHATHNFNYNMTDVYYEYMYDKEINNLKESEDKVLPAVKIAVDWWAKTISEDTRGGSLGNDFDSKLKMAILSPKKEEITEEQLILFKDNLTNILMKKVIEKKGEVIQMECDYGPDQYLYMAMESAGINSYKHFPFKTSLYLRPFWVGVNEGYAGSDVDLYDSTCEEDIIGTKERYCKLYNINNSFTKVLK